MGGDQRPATGDGVSEICGELLGSSSSSAKPFSQPPLRPQARGQGEQADGRKTACKSSSPYCPSFTAAGLRADLAAVIAGIYLEEGSWTRTKAAMLARNALQARSTSSGKRLESELRQRLQQLSTSQLELLAQGCSEKRCSMAWLAALKRIPITQESPEHSWPKSLTD